MPIYEYSCRKCGEVVEVLVKMGSRPRLVCGKCGGKKFERKFSVFGTGDASSRSSGGSCTGPT